MKIPIICSKFRERNLRTNFVIFLSHLFHFSNNELLKHVVKRKTSRVSIFSDVYPVSVFQIISYKKEVLHTQHGKHKTYLQHVSLRMWIRLEATSGVKFSKFSHFKKR